MLKGYMSVRSKKPLLPNYVYSIYKKGKIRKERIDRDYDIFIYDVKFLSSKY